MSLDWVKKLGLDKAVLGFRLYRAYYEAKSNISDMWKGNPALTAVLFGLPIGFLSLICYSICCADIMDAEEDDEDEAGAEIKLLVFILLNDLVKSILSQLTHEFFQYNLQNSRRKGIRRVKDKVLRRA